MQQNSLRWLADHYLQQTIQRGAHDSKEDAIAALRLVNLKLQQGPFFGMSHTAEAHNLVDVLHEQGRYNLLPSNNFSIVQCITCCLQQLGSLF